MTNQPPEYLHWTGLISASTGVNLRTGPGSQYRVLTVLLKGHTVEVVHDWGDWLQVTVDNQIGYVDGAYVERCAQPPIVSPSIAASILKIWTPHKEIIKAQSESLGIDPAVATAVLLAEFGSQAYGSDRRIIIQFQNHIFKYELKPSLRKFFHQHFRVNSRMPWSWHGHRWRPKPSMPWQDYHGSQQSEWEIFNFARQVDEEAAMRSISMGAPQIMGFNHLLLGYQSAREMFDAFQLEEHNQIKGLFQFIEAQGMNVPLRNKDFFAFTKMYNTSDQAEHYRDMIQQYVGCFEYVVNSPESLSFSEQLFQPVKAITGDCFSARVLEAHPPVRFSTIADKVDPAIHEANPELYAAWRKQIQRGLDNSNTICSQILSTFMKPYHSVIWMYRILFALGILAFITAAMLVYLLQDTPFKALFMAALFVGLGSFSLLSWFLSRPLQALEKNLHLNTCLGIIYNTYSTHLASTDPETFHDEVRCATNNAIWEIERLIDNEAFLYKNSPNPPHSDKVSINAGNNLIKNLSRTTHS